MYHVSKKAMLKNNHLKHPLLVFRPTCCSCSAEGSPAQPFCGGCPAWRIARTLVWKNWIICRRNIGFLIFQFLLPALQVQFSAFRTIVVSKSEPSSDSASAQKNGFRVSPVQSGTGLDVCAFVSDTVHARVSFKLPVSRPFPIPPHSPPTSLHAQVMLFCLAIGDQPTNLKLGIVMLDEGVSIGASSIAEWTHTLQQHAGVSSIGAANGIRYSTGWSK
jgi:hypothetical protein